MAELGLVMGGGGARSAYQVGALRWLAGRYPRLAPPIVTGVSAGAINAIYMASHPGNMDARTLGLCECWSRLTVDQVFRSNVGALGKNIVRWGLRLVMGGAKAAPRTRGFVDTAPLRDFLEKALAGHGAGIGGVQRNLAEGTLKAVALTTSSYSTGRSITWVQSSDRNLANWERPHRHAVSTELTLDHVLASASLPLFFPAVRIGDEWHGDGGMRLTTPLAPALHLGAQKILAVSTRYQKSKAEAEQVQIVDYPPPAQVLSALLNAVFLDNLDFDALILERINRLIAACPEAQPGDLRPVELFVLRPSQDLGKLASRYEPQLKGAFRWLTRSAGTRETKSPDSLSMLMFQPDYIAQLIELGERDAAAAGDELARFLETEPRPVLR